MATSTGGFLSVVSTLLLLLQVTVISGQQQASAGTTVKEVVIPAEFGTTTTTACSNDNNNGSDSRSDACFKSITASSLLEAAYGQIQWMEQRGGSFAHDQIEVRPTMVRNNPNGSATASGDDDAAENGLLGYFATQDIPQNTILMRIPRSILITAGKCRRLVDAWPCLLFFFVDVSYVSWFLFGPRQVCNPMKFAAQR
jgi:hypothetical protein